MANEWTSSGTSACFDGSAENIPLQQIGVLEAGMLFFIKVSILNSTQGKISIKGFQNIHEFTGNGHYTFIDKATDTDLSINPMSAGAGIFNGCINGVEASEVPYYTIKDGDGNIVFSQTDNTGVTADNDFIQYQIDWTSIAEGCYYIEFESQTLSYKTDCLRIALLHPCTLQLQWKNKEDGLGFGYSGLSFEPSMRVEGKLWKWHYITEDKQVFEFSNGNSKILYARNFKEQLLTIKELPEYMHDALAVALNHDNFYVDSVSYIWREEEVTPTHRKMTNAPSVEINIRRQGQNLLNSNCG